MCRRAPTPAQSYPALARMQCGESARQAGRLNCPEVVKRARDRCNPIHFWTFCRMLHASKCIIMHRFASLFDFFLPHSDKLTLLRSSGAHHAKRLAAEAATPAHPAHCSTFAICLHIMISFGAASIDRRMPIRTIPKHTDGINNCFGKIRKKLGYLYLEHVERVGEFLATDENRFKISPLRTRRCAEEIRSPGFEFPVSEPWN